VQKAPLPREPVVAKVPLTGGPSQQPVEVSDVAAKRYRSSLDERNVADCYAVLCRHLETGAWKDSALSMESLSQATGISTHHISQAINVGSGGHFYDWVNGYRIAAARRLLRETRLPVVDICFEVGFNSKSSFYTAFKKCTSQTPGQYRQAKRTHEAVVDE